MVVYHVIYWALCFVLLGVMHTQAICPHPEHVVPAVWTVQGFTAFHMVQVKTDIQEQCYSFLGLGDVLTCHWRGSRPPAWVLVQPWGCWGNWARICADGRRAGQSRMFSASAVPHWPAPSWRLHTPEQKTRLSDEYFAFKRWLEEDVLIAPGEGEIGTSNPFQDSGFESGMRIFKYTVHTQTSSGAGNSRHWSNADK